MRSQRACILLATNSHEAASAGTKGSRAVASMFLFPSMLLTITSLAVLYIEPEEEPVVWQWQEQFSYLLASG